MLIIPFKKKHLQYTLINLKRFSITLNPLVPPPLIAKIEKLLLLIKLLHKRIIQNFGRVAQQAMGKLFVALL
jgi:hypothetical protein